MRAVLIRNTRRILGTNLMGLLISLRGKTTQTGIAMPYENTMTNSLNKRGEFVYYEYARVQSARKGDEVVENGNDEPRSPKLKRLEGWKRSQLGRDWLEDLEGRLGAELALQGSGCPEEVGNWEPVGLGNRRKTMS